MVEIAGQRAGRAGRLKRRAGHLSIALNVGRRWSRPEPQPANPFPLAGVRLNALIPTWCEQDVIGSTVANLFAQGCERVLLVDNGSPDETVGRARAAGAEIATVYQTPYFDDQRKLAEMSAAIERHSPEDGAEHVWWLLCDADEFPHGPSGLTLSEYVSGLDRRFRVAGARVFDHFPSAAPAFETGRHPLDYQPLCQEVSMAWCAARHWKHPLIRWDRGGERIGLVSGFHRTSTSGDVIVEPTSAFFIHHFQYRDRDTTYERLRHLCEPDAEGRTRTALQDERRGNETGAKRRLATLDHVYAREWDKVERPGITRWKRGVHPRPWEEQVPAADAEVARWY